MSEIILKEKINSDEETNYIFDCGSLNKRENVIFEKDVEHCLNIFCNETIKQKISYNLDVSLIYTITIEDYFAESLDKGEFADQIGRVNKLVDLELKLPILKLLRKTEYVLKDDHKGKRVGSFPSNYFDATEGPRVLNINPNILKCENRDIIIDKFLINCRNFVSEICFESDEFIYYKDLNYHSIIFEKCKELGFVGLWDAMMEEFFTPLANFCSEKYLLRDLNDSEKMEKYREWIDNHSRNEDIIRERLNNPNWKYDSFWNLEEERELPDLEEKWMRKLYETLYDDLKGKHSAEIHFDFL